MFQSIWKNRDLPSLTIFIFGVLALALGIIGILLPGTLLSLLGFENAALTQRASYDYTLVYLMASSMASINMGVYYILAAVNNVKQFYNWTVPFRVLTFLVFTGGVLAGYAPPRFWAVALWELTGAVLTGVAILHERRKHTPVKPILPA